jgi:hypothetical protein
MKNYIKEDIQPVNKGNYQYISFENGTDKDSLDTQLLSDINDAAYKSRVKVTVTSAVSNHKKQTSSGTPSRHSTGNAVDISKYNGYAWSSKQDAKDKKLFNSMEYFIGRLKDKGYVVNDESGQNKAVLWFGFSDKKHEDHIHISTPPSSTTGGDSNTSSSSSSKSFDELSFLNPALDVLKTTGQAVKKSFDKKVSAMTENNLELDKKIISEIKRINNLMKK